MSQGIPPQVPPVMPLQYAQPMPPSAVRAVGIAQRRLMWVILGAILLTFSFVAGSAITHAVPAMAFLALAVLMLVRIALIVLMMICIYQMTAARGSV